MGCDIHAYAEVKGKQGWEFIGEVWDCRRYGLFGWLADVRNYSGVTPTEAVTDGLPTDLSPAVAATFKEWQEDAHTLRHAALSDLLSVDYDQIILDRRVTRQVSANVWDGGRTTDDPSEAKQESLRKFLGDAYFKDIEKLRSVEGEVRVVFWFDN